MDESPVVCVAHFRSLDLFPATETGKTKKHHNGFFHHIVSAYSLKVFRAELLSLFCVGTWAALAPKCDSLNASQLFVLGSSHWSCFHGHPHYRADKPATPSNICLLIIHSAGAQMAAGSSSLAPGTINQFLQQLWVNADTLKFNSLLYEVCCSPHYVNEASLIMLF